MLELKNKIWLDENLKNISFWGNIVLSTRAYLYLWKIMLGWGFAAALIVAGADFLAIYLGHYDDIYNVLFSPLYSLAIIVPSLFIIKNIKSKILNLNKSEEPSSKSFRDFWSISITYVIAFFIGGAGGFFLGFGISFGKDILSRYFPSTLMFVLMLCVLIFLLSLGVWIFVQGMKTILCIPDIILESKSAIESVKYSFVIVKGWKESFYIFLLIIIIFSAYILMSSIFLMLIEHLMPFYNEQIKQILAGFFTWSLTVP